jgi:hypothetical protein
MIKNEGLRCIERRPSFYRKILIYFAIITGKDFSLTN